MTWNSVTNDHATVAQQVIWWIRTVREAGQKSYSPPHPYFTTDWLPSPSDIHKSALFERIRSGKAPLREPPPIGLACPWYALVEDPGPHWVMDISDRKEDGRTVIVLNNAYIIEHELSPLSYIVSDGGKETSYRFRLWHDATWRHPSTPHQHGAWFMRNIEFEVTE